MGNLIRPYLTLRLLGLLFKNVALWVAFNTKRNEDQACTTLPNGILPWRHAKFLVCYNYFHIPAIDISRLMPMYSPTPAVVYAVSRASIRLEVCSKPSNPLQEL